MTASPVRQRGFVGNESRNGHASKARNPFARRTFHFFDAHGETRRQIGFKDYTCHAADWGRGMDFFFGTSGTPRYRGRRFGRCVPMKPGTGDQHLERFCDDCDYGFPRSSATNRAKESKESRHFGGKLFTAAKESKEGTNERHSSWRDKFRGDDVAGGRLMWGSCTNLAHRSLVSAWIAPSDPAQQ